MPEEYVCAVRIETYKTWPKGYYHLSTDGKWDGTIFHTPELFAFGMTLLGLVTLHFPLKLYDFSLMDNHLHLLLSGTGKVCTDAFHYMVRKLNIRLGEAGWPPLPENYGFKLVPVESKEQLANVFIYIDRNAYEKQISIPGGYPWSAAMLHHSKWGAVIKGVCADTLKKRELIRLTGSRKPVPGNWEFHPVLGLLPKHFVQNRKFLELFPTPKVYESRLVKDYEAVVKVAETLEESVDFSPEEMDGIMNLLLVNRFNGKTLGTLSNEEKGRLAVMLGKDYHLSPAQIAIVLEMPEYLVKQSLNSKDFGRRK